MKSIQKSKGLPDMLKELKIGETVDIQPSAYKINYVQTAARRLRDKGFLFKVTEKGLITGCHVTRVR
jgi:hypothetical protein